MNYSNLLPTLCIVIIIGITVAIGGVSIVAATLGIIYCRWHKKGMHKDKHKHPTLIICRHIWKSKIIGEYARL